MNTPKWKSCAGSYRYLKLRDDGVWQVIRYFLTYDAMETWAIETGKGDFESIEHDGGSWGTNNFMPNNGYCWESKDVHGDK